MAMCGTPLGGAVSGPIVGLIAIHWGWKASFVLIMLIGLIWTWFWMTLIKDRPTGVQSAVEGKKSLGKKGPAFRCPFI